MVSHGEDSWQREAHMNKIALLLCDFIPIKSYIMESKIIQRGFA